LETSLHAPPPKKHKEHYSKFILILNHLKSKKYIHGCTTPALPIYGTRDNMAFFKKRLSKALIESYWLTAFWVLLCKSVDTLKEKRRLKNYEEIFLYLYTGLTNQLINLALSLKMCLQFRISKSAIQVLLLTGHNSENKVYIQVSFCVWRCIDLIDPTSYHFSHM